MHNHTSKNSLAGVLVLLVTTVIFAAQDAITKELTILMPVGQILFFRFVAFALFVTFYLKLRGTLWASAKSARPLMQVSRMLFMLLEMSIFAWGLRFLGLAEMHAVFSCFPLVITALSAPLLGESVGWRRWLAVTVGFIGTLIILQPGTGVFDLYAVIPLVCAVLYGLYNILTRKVARFDSFDTSLLYFGFVGLLVSFVFGVSQWQSVPEAAYMPLLLLCVTSVMAHMMLIKALELAPAVVLQPINYLILVWAVLIAIVYFNESISMSTWVGVSIVVASGLYVVFREYRLAKLPRESP